MGRYYSPYDQDQPLNLKCSCGGNHSAAEHPVPSQGSEASETQIEARASEFVEAALVKALFPQDNLRRNFLKAVGRTTAMAAISSMLPVTVLQALAQEQKPVEKKDLKIGFLPITCATPIVAADPLGFYAKNGLNVELNRTAGWAVVRDKVIAGEFDASHMLSPMPLAMTLGLGATATPMVMPAIENVNGNAITLHIKHKDKRDPKTWKGMRFGIPFDYSMHNFLLR
ncbi:MAG: ABC transporter substrate-binding protein, partial [Burkholderiales bacterium]|nr:ABC transporter substrate-binding protein [Burkholderiales bacterium]